ncbi:hypothetical protein SAMN05444000_10198 [Shimia gijangensis]|uniref:Uncharacterized protein n=1 Tax=Shimia gijangensis TaxID=1470563 RepID=A0A1M6B0Z5_9RHOB|nr:hypothetical protein [Shimia gijangensis]SHI42396.1 hypothetical protein SAMN05444000_10198 [Shimia gijangensis]
MRPDRKKPLYRKVNTRTHGVHHGCGRLQMRDGEAGQGMRQGLRHGLDYTPLYKFLLSRVGKPWDEVFSEALTRLPEEAPIWHIVAHSELEAEPIIRAGESSYYSGLFVDDAGQLSKVDATLEAETMRPACPCCTHTFNGQRFGLACDAPEDTPQG